MTATATDERVRSRLAEDISEAEEALNRAMEAVRRTDEEYTAAAEADLTAWEKLDKTKGDTQGTDVEKAQARAARKREAAFNSAQAALAEAQTAKRRLEDLKKPGELDRRLERAERFVELRVAAKEKDGEPTPTKPKRMSVRDAAVAVLKMKGRAMHSREITKVALEEGLWRSNGNTPEATLNAALAVSAKAGETFVRVAPSVYDLKERADG